MSETVYYISSKLAMYVATYIHMFEVCVQYTIAIPLYLGNLHSKPSVFAFPTDTVLTLTPLVKVTLILCLVLADSPVN